MKRDKNNSDYQDRVVSPSPRADYENIEQDPSYDVQDKPAKSNDRMPMGSIYPADRPLYEKSSPSLLVRHKEFR